MQIQKPGCHILIWFFTESPLQFYVNYPNSGNVTAYGPGLVYGVANKPAVFTIVTEDAGEGKWLAFHSSESEFHSVWGDNLTIKV